MVGLGLLRTGCSQVSANEARKGEGWRAVLRTGCSQVSADKA